MPVLADTFVKARINNKLKNDASTILKGFDLSLSTAIRIFLIKLVKENDLPFSTKNMEFCTMADAVVKARLDKVTKKDASSILIGMDLSLSEGIRMFLSKIVEEKTVSFLFSRGK